MLAIIGGSAKRFVPFVDLYKKASERSEKTPGAIGAHSPGHVAETDEQAQASHAKGAATAPAPTRTRRACCTRASTVVTVDHLGRGRIAERRFNASGLLEGESVLSFTWS